MAEICECCGTPDTEVELELRGHGSGWLFCVGGCPPRHTVRQRVYAELTSEVLDQLDTEADVADRDCMFAVEVPPEILRTLVRAARSAV